MNTISPIQTPKLSTCPRLPNFLTIAWIVLITLFGATTLRAASPYAGTYTGPVYSSTSGANSLPEQGVGFIRLTVDQDGAITDLGGDLTGTVDEAGVITWNVPNPFHFTTGEIIDDAIVAAGSSSDGHVTLHTRIDASSAVPERPKSSVGLVTQLNPTQSLAEMYRVRYANDRFMAVGSQGAVAFSNDGMNWNRFGLNTNVSDIAFGNGIYIVVGASHSRSHSTDGKHWTALPKPLDQPDILGVAFGNGAFVTADSLGNVQTSTDGLEWNDVGSPLAGSGSPYVDYINERFVLKRDSSLTYSEDGVAWSEPIVHPAGETPFSRQLFAYGNGRYVVGGTNGLAYSSDGVEWTMAETVATDMGFVAFGMGAFYARDDDRVLWRSVDGSEWIQIQAFNAINPPWSMAFSDSIGVAVGRQLYTSTDGFAWNDSENDATAPNMRNVYVPSQIASDYSTSSWGLLSDFSVGPFGAVGPIGIRASNALFDSLATETTVRLGDHGFIDILRKGVQSQPTPLTDRNLRTAIEHSDGLVIAGDGGVMIRLSPPTTEDDSPVLEMLPSITQADLLSSTSTPANPDSRIIVGSFGTILRSTDPTLREWSMTESGSSSRLRHVDSYPQLDNLLIAVGDNGTILTSADGSNWTVRDSNSSVNFVGSMFDSDHILVAGEDGTLVVSQDGITWKRAGRLPTSQRLAALRTADLDSPHLPKAVGARGVYITPSLVGYNGSIGASHRVERLNLVAGFLGASHGNGRFVLVGNKTASSTDGINWQTRPGPFEIRSAAFGNGRFVGVGRVGGTRDGKVGTSINGLDWEVHETIPSSQEFRTVAYGGGRFAAAGVGDNDASFVWTSEDGIAWIEHLLPSTHNIFSIAYHDGTFVGVGTGFVRSTDNGQTWTTGSISGGPYNAVTYGNGRFVAVGRRTGWIADSTDGTSWTSHLLPVPVPNHLWTHFYSIAFVNNEFMITTPGAIFRSDTGTAETWTRLPTGIPVGTSATIVAGGRYIMAGTNHIYSIPAPDPGSPMIVGQPLDQSIPDGGTLVLTAKAIGGDSLEYLWFHDGQLLQNDDSVSGADSPTLTVANLSIDSAGSYEFVATNPHGSRASRQAKVTVTLPFDDWIAQYDVPPGLDGPEDDANDDGISNKIDFALGGNPTIPHSAQLPTAVEAVVDDVIYPALQFTRNRNATGVEIQVSGSTTLTSNESPELVETLEDLGYGVDLVTIRSTTPLPNITTFFFEVRLTTQ